MYNFFKKRDEYFNYKDWHRENFYAMRIKLHPDNWKKCNSCDGTGSYYISGDLHKSGGVVPCDCSNGIIKSKIVYIPNNAKFKIALRRKQ